MASDLPTSDGRPDADNPEWTAADFARARPADAVAALAGVMDVLVRKPGRPTGPMRPLALALLMLAVPSAAQKNPLFSEPPAWRCCM